MIKLKTILKNIIKEFSGADSAGDSDNGGIWTPPGKVRRIPAGMIKGWTQIDMGQKADNPFGDNTEFREDTHDITIPGGYYNAIETDDFITTGVNKKGENFIQKDVKIQDIEAKGRNVIKEINTKLKDIINEIGDASSKKFKWRQPSGAPAKKFKKQTDKLQKTGLGDEAIYEFTTDKGTRYSVHIEYTYNPQTDYLRAEVDFYTYKKGKLDTDMSVTNLGEIFPVMATITDIFISWLNEWDKYYYVDRISITPKQEEEDDSPDATGNRRGKLYSKYIKQQLKRTNNKSGSYVSRAFSDEFRIEPRWEKEDHKFK